MNFTKLRIYLPHLLSTVILLVFFGYLYRNIDRYLKLLDLASGSILLLLGLILVFISIAGLTNYNLYRGLGVPLTLNESVGLAIVNTLANQLPFTGGLVAKGFYLKRKYALAYTHFLSATLALYVCLVITSGVIGLMVLGYLRLVAGKTVPIPLVMGFLGLTMSLGLFWLPLDTSFVSHKWAQRIGHLMQGWRVLSQNRRLIAELVVLGLLGTLVMAGRFWIVFHMLSQEITLLQCILFSSSLILTNLVNITPGALGIREGIVAGVAVMLGFDAGISVVATSIDRLVALLVIIILGTFYTHILSKQVISIQSESVS